MTSRLCLEGIYTLLNAIVELVIRREEVIRGGERGVIGRDRFDQRRQGGFNSVQLALKNSLHVACGDAFYPNPKQVHDIIYDISGIQYDR